ncbi:MAG TPA: 2'-5' RNA ligase family protein [Nitrospirota bacterium]|nr:2'-5' RNA ligase family protein [Nitrospirota bacterium]
MLHQGLETIPASKRDYVEWHRGRAEYGLWLIELGTEELFQQVYAAREHLSDFLLKPYYRQPHISVFICGFPAETLSFDDDYSVEQFHAQAELLKNADIRPFDIEVGGLNSFASAAFLEVEDPHNGIEQVRAVLSTTAREIGRSSFTPHVTVGLYSQAFPSSFVTTKISTFQRKPVRLTVNQITFATYEARKIGGALTGKHRVALHSE